MRYHIYYMLIYARNSTQIKSSLISQFISPLSQSSAYLHVVTPFLK